MVARFAGEAFRRARETARLTRGDLAASLCLSSVDRVRIWEDELEAPRPAMIPEIARVLATPPPKLLRDVGDPPSLSALRLEAGLTGAEVVRRASTLTTMTYHRLDTGRGPQRPPDPAVVAELAAILGVPDEAVAAGIAQAQAMR